MRSGQDRVWDEGGWYLVWALVSGHAARGTLRSHAVRDIEPSGYPIPAGKEAEAPSDPSGKGRYFIYPIPHPLTPQAVKGSQRKLRDTILGADAALFAGSVKNLPLSALTRRGRPMLRSHIFVALGTA